MTVISRNKTISQAGGSDITPVVARITNLENGKYKITYYEIVTGTSGSLTIPTGATINAGEFGLSGNAILSKIDGSNKTTFQSPVTAAGVIVTATLNVTTGAWVASGVYTDASVALIYSINITALNLNNLVYDRIIETSLNETVTTSKIHDLAVTTPKIADAAITQAQLKIKTVVVLADAAATLTATQMVDSGIFTITPTVARILTTDTAANIVAALPRYQVGTWFDFTIINTAAFDVTLAAGTGITLSGGTVIHAGSSTWKARIDSATAITIYNTSLFATTTGTGENVRSNTPTIITPVINGNISGTTIIPSANGGTGKNNGFNITIAGALETTGAFNTTLAAQATVVTTLPPVATTLVGKTGTAAANQIPFYADANQIKTSANFTFDGATLSVLAADINVSVGKAIRLGGELALSRDASNVYMGTAATYNLLLYSGGTSVNGTIKRISIPVNTGRVGINVDAPTAILHLSPGSDIANGSPFKLTSGALTTGANITAGSVEFLTDKLYFTITTGAARKTIAFLESPAFITPNLGTPSAGVLTNATGLPTTGLLDGAVTSAKLSSSKVPYIGIYDYGTYDRTVYNF